MIKGTVVVLNRGWLCSPLTEWLWGLNRSEYHYQPVVGGEIAQGRNRGVLAMQGSFVLFVDSDCVPASGAEEQLQGHRVGIIGGVYLERSGCMEVCTTKTFEPTVRYTLREINAAKEAFPVLATGTGILLIRRYVLEALRPPWFRCGQLVPEFLTEDTEFCLRAAERGYPTYVDPAVRVGHVLKGTLWPGEGGSPWVAWEGSPAREPLYGGRWLPEGAHEA